MDGYSQPAPPLAPPPDHCTVAVIGGGIIGCAVARELQARQPRWSVALFEREGLLATHQSSRNSGVIHSGIYYRPGSLKARLCVEGAARLYDYCERRGLPYRRCGKLVVALADHELKPLRLLAARARSNGVVGVELLDRSGLRRREPHCAGVAALYSPNTGVTDFRLLANAFAADLVELGGTVTVGCEVARIAQRPRSLLLSHRLGETRSSSAIVCAGAGATALARASGAAGEPRIVPFRGSYRELVEPSASLVGALIYPLPDPRLPFLGVHISRHLDGRVTVGPTALPQPWGEGGSGGVRGALGALAYPGLWRLGRRWWRTGARELAMSLWPEAIARAARRYLPELEPADLRPSFYGLRAQAVEPDGSLVDDFRFERYGRALYVRNAPSPAATASLAIARHIVGQAQEAFRW